MRSKAIASWTTESSECELKDVGCPIDTAREQAVAFVENPAIDVLSPGCVRPRQFAVEEDRFEHRVVLVEEDNNKLIKVPRADWR